MNVNFLTKGISTYVKKNPGKVVALAATSGLLGFGIAKSLTKTKKEVTEDMNRIYLMNPYFNPFGYYTHLLNPADTSINELDSPLAKYMIDKNNKNYDKYYDNLPPAEKVREYYANGGKGLNFEKEA